MRNGFIGQQISGYPAVVALKDKLVEVNAYSRDDSMMSGRLTVK